MLRLLMLVLLWMVGPVVAAEFQVDIVGFVYSPSSLIIAPGDTITWTNQDVAPHTATADDESWDTGILQQGESASLVFGGSERVESYFCAVHPSMKASFEVGPLGVGGDAPGLPTVGSRISSIAPNPFNPATSIQFSLEEPSRVLLSIHGAAGHRIRTLLREKRSGGDHAVQWDGTDDYGRELASGVYLVRLKTDNRVGTTRIILVK